MLKKSIHAYLQTKQRVNQDLQNLLSQIELEENSYVVIKQVIKIQCTPLQGLKWLVFLHKLIITQYFEKNIIDELISLLATSNSEDFDKILNLRLIKPYTLFLRKRLQLQKQDTKDINQSYFIINTIWVCLSFVDILYTFGRYYVAKCPFFIDFNILLGIDLKNLYNKMNRAIPVSNRKLFVADIQKIHQKMYIVYYNCYFHKYLKVYIPRWIKTQSQSFCSSKSIKTASSSNSKRPFDMSQSTLCLPKAQQNSRLQIIKSLQRIVSLFE